MRHGIHNRIRLWIAVGIVAGAAAWLGWAFVSAQTACNFTITSLPTSISNQGSTYCLASTITGSGQISVLADDITLDGQNRVSVVSANVASGNGKNRLTIKDLKISGGISFNGGNTHQIINTTTSGVILYNVKNDNVVRSNTINGAFQIYGVFTGSSPFSENNVIENNTLTFNGLRNDDSGQQSRFFRLSYVRYSQVRNNTVTLTNSQGINFILYDVHYSTFENNTFTMTFCSGCGGVGANIRDRSSYNTFVGNTFDSGNGGIQINLGCCGSPLPNNNVFRNNKSFARATALYLHSSGPNNQFDHNLFYATTQEAVNISGIGGDSGSGSAIFTNNTVVADSGVALRNDKAAASAQQVTLKNNILYSRDDYAFSTNTGGVTYTSNYNDFYRADGGSLISYGAVARTLSSYRQASGQDANSISGNPLFVNYATKDFRLQSSSPARGAGENGVDQGAFPYATGGCTENWQCTAWSTCTNNQQSRTCTDLNNCGTTSNRPPLTQSCDSTAPTVSVTAPANGATVSGTVTVSATASDNVGVAGIQFKLDGQNLGSEDASSPFSISWDTLLATNGSHTLTAVARDAAGNTATSAPVLVTVDQSSCTENWQCGAWSSCVSGQQTRTCTDQNNCGTTTSRPPLTQSCTTSAVSCGTACSGVAAPFTFPGCTNRRLASACTPNNQCDGTNIVHDIHLSVGSVAAGSSLDVTVDYGCWDNRDSLAVWYSNGSAWRLIQSWAPGSLTNCDQIADGKDAALTASFTPDSNPGTHYVRAVEAAGTRDRANAASCPNLEWGDVDDMAFTVTAQSCIENWQCSDWGPCENEKQTRICTDINTCGTTNNRPPLSQPCTVPDTTPPGPISDLTGR